MWLGNFGFSYVGFLFLLMLFIPNIIWTKHQPKGYNPAGENKILRIFERVGQLAVVLTVLIFKDYNIHAWSLWTLWHIASFVLMLIYEIWWIRYFIGEKTLNNFYRSFFGVPLPGATLPIAAFLLLGVYGKVIWLIISVLILGIGHIGIHHEHWKECKKTKI